MRAASRSVRQRVAADGIWWYRRRRAHLHGLLRFVRFLHSRCCRRDGITSVSGFFGIFISKRGRGRGGGEKKKIKTFIVYTTGLAISPYRKLLFLHFRTAATTHYILFYYKYIQGNHCFCPAGPRLGLTLDPLFYGNIKKKKKILKSISEKNEITEYIASRKTCLYRAISFCHGRGR